MVKGTYIAPLLLTLAGWGCKREVFYPDTNTVRVPITVWWDRAQITPQNATVLIYRADGSLYKEVLLETNARAAKSTVQSTANLEPGRYTVVAFNELRNQIPNVGIRGAGRLETLEAYALSASSSIYAFGRTESHDLVNEPGVLAATVTEVVIESGCNAPIELHPERKTATAHIELQVDGLDRALLPAAMQLRNMAASYFFATDQNSLRGACAQHTIKDRAGDQALATTVSTFGVVGERHHTADTPDEQFFIDVAFMMRDASVHTASIDITQAMEIAVDEHRAVSIAVRAQTDRLPDVVVPKKEPGGFETKLVDWKRTEITLN